MESTKKYNPNYDGSVFLRSCEKVVIEPIEGIISGAIPLWINGALLRNGPGQLKVGDHEFKHLFDSMALLQRFEIKNGKVTFQCRFLESEVYKANTKANRIVFSDFGTEVVPEPCQTIFERFFSMFESRQPGDNACVSLYPFGDEIYSFTDTPFIFKIDKKTLETKKRIDLRNLSIVYHTSHPQITEDGVYNLAVSKNGPTHNIVRFSNKSKEHQDDYSMYDTAEIVASIPVRWRFHPTYMHSFGITTNYFIIIEHPTCISVFQLAINVLRKLPVLNSFRFYPDELTQISVISRKTGQLSYKFYTDAFFFFHVINQYEDNDHIILDVCTYEDESIMCSATIDKLRDVHNDSKYADLFRSTAVRLVLPLLNSNDSTDLNENLVTLKDTKAKAFFQEDGTIYAKWEVLSNFGCEFPTINRKNQGVKYRYFYAISSELDCDYPGAIIKVDCDEKTAKRWYEDNCFANEPIFIPHPEAEDEDDGVVLSNIVWGKDDTHRTGLVILNAKTMDEIGRAEFKVPGAVSKGYHGWFCAN